MRVLILDQLYLSVSSSRHTGLTSVVSKFERPRSVKKKWGVLVNVAILAKPCKERLLVSLTWKVMNCWLEMLLYTYIIHYCWKKIYQYSFYKVHWLAFIPESKQNTNYTIRQKWRSSKMDFEFLFCWSVGSSILSL